MHRLPLVSELIDNSVTEQQFKNGLNAILEFLKDVEIQSYTVSSKNLLSGLEPKTGDFAKTLDDSKVWFYDGVKWIDTLSSDLDLAINFLKKSISEISIRGGLINTLFEFRDSADQIAVLIKEDGNIITPKANLHDVAYKANHISKAFNDLKQAGGSVNNLYEFNDVNNDLVIAIKEDGNIITPKANLHDVSEKAEVIYKSKDLIRDLDHTLERGLSENLYEFNDSDDSLAVAFTPQGNIQFNGGITLNRNSLISAENARSCYEKEFAHPEYLQMSLQRLLLSNVSNISPFIGSFKQNFSISNIADFLNLKISQPPAISIDTPYIAKDLMPYSSQVVHPYVCEFTKTVHGWKYILVITPFHNTHDLMENPCIYGSNDLKSFELLQGFEQPIAIAKPLDQYNYNSDPCAIFDHQTGEFVCLYRNSVLTLDNTSVEYSTLHTRRTKDFVNWSDVKDIDIDNGDLSPTLVFDTTKNKWLMFSGNGGFCVRESERIEGPWSAPVVISTPFVPWHQEVKYCGNHFVGIFNDLERRVDGGEGDMYFGISSDGLTWQFSESIFTGSFVGPYKPSISHEFVDASNIRFNIVWTSSDRNADFADRWRLYSTKTQSLGVI